MKRTGAQQIMDERNRQTSQEGWTQEHDDAHTGGELVRAAICYAQNPITHPLALRHLGRGHPADLWPWEPEWWKPKDAIMDLVRAGALIAAEIDRLGRLEEKGLYRSQEREE